MALLTGLTPDGQEVPVQVDATGRLVAEGLQGQQGDAGPAGPTGPAGPAGPAGDSQWVRSGSDIGYTQGRVGIGTSSPGAVLHSVGTGSGSPATSGATQTYCSLRLGGSNSTGVVDFGISGSANWIQSTDRTDLSQKYSLLLNPNGGSVGIGTTAPGQLLEIHGASNPAALVINTTSNVQAYFYANSTAGIFGTPTVHPLVFNVENLEKARIDTSGRLLVGTNTAPAGSVAGSVTAKGGVCLQSPDGSWWTLSVSDAGNVTATANALTKRE